LFGNSLGETKMKYAVFSALMSVALIVPNVTVAQNDDTGLEHVLVEMANTPAEHEALERHFTALAQQAREDARRHEQLSRTYTRVKSGNPQLSNHCQRLAQKYSEIAAEYDELAKLHEQEARSAQR
jgi:chromosome segregation ATPase